MKLVKWLSDRQHFRSDLSFSWHTLTVTETSTVFIVFFVHFDKFKFVEFLRSLNPCSRLDKVTIIHCL